MIHDRELRVRFARRSRRSRCCRRPDPSRAPSSSVRALSARRLLRHVAAVERQVDGGGLRAGRQRDAERARRRRSRTPAGGSRRREAATPVRRGDAWQREDDRESRQTHVHSPFCRVRDASWPQWRGGIRPRGGPATSSARALTAPSGAWSKPVASVSAVKSPHVSDPCSMRSMRSKIVSSFSGGEHE